MDTSAILSLLGYEDSPFYLKGAQLNEHPGYSHIFRRASRKCSLRGVYTLREQAGQTLAGDSLTPLVYVCEAENQDEAKRIHRLVWNQNLVPFLLIATQHDFRLYAGFSYDAGKRERVRPGGDQSVLRAAKKASEILKTFADFRAESINQGQIFQNRSNYITPDTRVDWRLLDSLRELSDQLTGTRGGLSRQIAHILIGKYVYLKYLRDRGILSDLKLDEWRLLYEDVFGRNAKKSGLYRVEKKLNGWLNGSVFPLPSKSTLDEAHIRKVASTFEGDDPGSGQMHLDFQAYDFAYIPIETLSVVYEQFLHAEGGGRKKGAYYTPIHLVNFILDELDAKRPLKRGMKVFDASCGSGAFLVQCYRRLIERAFVPKLGKGIEPKKLSVLLTEHIYGLDVDQDACGVTELSLILTLLDYVDPPDLTHAKAPLPVLRNRNIFFCEKGFFDPGSKWEKAKAKKGYAWIVGNPPWKGINAERPEKFEPGDELALEWMVRNKARWPVSSNQLAEAFAWKVTECLGEKGLVGLLLPAASLFKKTAERFRSEFFGRMDSWCVVNFSNLRHILFRGAVKPAVAVFYSAGGGQDKERSNSITTYAPFAVEQLARYFGGDQKRKESWSVIVNSSNIKEISFADAVSGSNLPWKLAMWGSTHDKRLLSSLARRFDLLGSFADGHGLAILEGFQLKRIKSGDEAQKLVSDGVVKVVEKLVGQKKLNMEALKGCKYVFSFPDEALVTIDADEAYLRVRGGEAPLKVCEPPHVIVDAARKFSVFSNDFIVVPQRQIGIGGRASQRRLLKALTLYLNSDFVYYHQFLTSKSSFGTERDLANKEDLMNIPAPLDNLGDKDMRDWGVLYEELVEASVKYHRETPGPLFEEAQPDDELKRLLKQLNKAVYEVLGVSKGERCLIDDLLNVRLKLNQGAIAREAMGLATKSEMMAYARIMKRELDGFMYEDEKNGRHEVKVYSSDEAGIIKIVHHKKAWPSKPEVIEVDEKTRAQFARLKEQLRREQGQWVYFNRGLKIFERRGRTSYLVKPRERLYWLKSQALVDADEFIADKLITL